MDMSFLTNYTNINVNIDTKEKWIFALHNFIYKDYSIE
jgi:hypothetical protein